MLFLTTFQLLSQCILWIILFITVTYLWNQRRYCYLAWIIPGIPFSKVTSFMKSCTNINAMKNLAYEIIRYIYSDTKLKKIWFGPVLLVFPMKPEDVQIILNSPHCKGKSELIYSVLTKLLGKSLFIKEGNLWGPLRKKLSPAFTKTLCDKEVGIIDSNTCIFIDKLKTKKAWSQSELSDLAQIISMDNFVKFATKTNILKYDDYIKLSVFLTSYLDIAFQRIMKFWYIFDVIFSFSKMNKTFTENADFVKNCSMKIIEERLQVRKTIKLTNFEELEHEKCFLDIILDMYEIGELSLEDASFELQGMLFAGTETSGKTLKNTLILLAMHQDIQNKLYEEIKDVLGEHDNTSILNSTDIHKMSYLDMVFKESMRIYTIASHTGRTTTNEVQLTDYIIPEGTIAVISPHLVHHNPTYWKKPMVFDPDRFSLENLNKMHKYSFIPFSGGPRNCIGSKFALTSLKAVLARLVHTFHISTDATMADMSHSMSFAIRWESLHPVNFIPRDK